MKKAFILLLSSIILTSATIPPKQGSKLNVLIGTWKLDMTPQDKTDSNFAMMRIDEVTPKGMKGVFYREGVALRNGNINAHNGKIYGALVSGDNSGEYNTSFYYKDGKIYGTTHAINRGFLAVWVAEKE